VTMFDRVRRGFFNVGKRAVHYRIVGGGPPALFIHSSPADSTFVVPDMLALAHRYTCVAFDTPGFGLSDPLPGDPLTVADLADATAAAMVAFGLPRVPVYGTHTGAAIALELGARHPARVSGLVLDGVPIFTRAEADALIAGYFIDLSPDILGGHFSRIWTRLRDQSIWFPWYARSPDQHNDYDLAAPSLTHRWMTMFLDAAAHYRPAYAAALGYCDQALVAVEALAVPAVFTASANDMLYPHLRRLPPLRAGQEIREFGIDPAAKHVLTGEMFDRFVDPGATLEHPPASVRATGRQFFAFERGDLLVRCAGERDLPCLLLLHDVPGSSRALEPLIAALSNSYFVVAPDLPGSGNSPGFGAGASMGDYVGVLRDLLDQLGIVQCAVAGIGFASSLALALARTDGGRVASVALTGVLLADATERQRLAAHHTPPIAIEADGSHWFRLWQQLRDTLIWWPWFDPRRDALRGEPADFAAGVLHDRTVEVMKQHTAYGELVAAVLAHDAGEDLALLSQPLLVLSGSASPLSRAYDARLGSLAPSARTRRYDGIAGLADALREI